MPKIPVNIKPSSTRSEIVVPDVTPGVVVAYASRDRHALLAKLRYNRIIDIFTGLTCYSLQSCLITSVTGVGRVEIDKIYTGVDKHGAHYVLSVQSAGQRDKIELVQIERNAAMCRAKFLKLKCRLIAAQLLADDLVALFACEIADGAIRVIEERHYRLTHSMGCPRRSYR